MVSIDTGKPDVGHLVDIVQLVQAHVAKSHALHLVGALAQDCGLVFYFIEDILYGKL
jgi:hypothetical protein